MYNIWFTAISVFITIYMIIPYLISRILGLGVFSKGKQAKQVAFTFDDGPDPNYTPKLLDLLKKHRVKATFFVLGSKAEKYPELTKRIHQEGHQIGIHNYKHIANWLMSPWKIKRQQVERSAEIIKNITGERPTYYRPPWGILNLGDFFWLRKSYRIVLWSVMAQDWSQRSGGGKLKDKLLKNIKPGSIVLLHDSGDTLGADEHAPKHMLEGLQEVIQEIHRQGYQCFRTDELLCEKNC